MSRRPQHLTLLCLATALFTSNLGCSALSEQLAAYSGSSRSGSTSSQPSPYIGTVTIENRSSYNLCQTALTGDPGTFVARIDAGQSATVTVSSQVNQLLMADCDQFNSLFGYAMNWFGRPIGEVDRIDGLYHDRIVVYPAGQAPADASDHLAVSVRPQPFEQWIFFNRMNNPSLLSTLHDGMQAWGQRNGVGESYEQFMLASDEFSIQRHELSGLPISRTITGAAYGRWPDGNCRVRGVTFEQQHDGNDFSGNWETQVGASIFAVNCRLLDYVATLPDSSSR